MTIKLLVIISTLDALGASSTTPDIMRISDPSVKTKGCITLISGSSELGSPVTPLWDQTSVYPLHQTLEVASAYKCINYQLNRKIQKPKPCYIYWQTGRHWAVEDHKG